MPVQASRDRIRVRGENAPILVLLGFALAGLIGSIITAWLLLPNLSDGSKLGVTRFENTSEAIQAPPAAAQLSSDETPAAPDLAIDKDASPDEQNKHPRVNTDAGLMIEQIPAGPGASDASAPDFGVSGTGTVGVASSGEPAPGFPATQQTSEDQILVDLTASGLASEEAGTPPPEQKHATPDLDDSATPTRLPVDPAKPAVQSAEGDAQRAADSESAVDNVASLEQTVDRVASECAPLFAVKFKRGDAAPLVADMAQKMQRLAAWLNANPGATLSLDGHADASGPEEFNLLLSFRRAAAVSALLEDAGASKTQLVVRAHGEGQSSSRSADAALERRVALTIDAGEPCDEPALEGGARR